MHAYIMYTYTIGSMSVASLVVIGAFSPYTIPPGQCPTWCMYSFQPLHHPTRIHSLNRLWALLVPNYTNTFVFTFITLTLMSGNSSNSNSSTSICTSGKLPKLVDDGTTNNYSKWKIESEIPFLRWDLLEYVSSSSSQPPNIPPLYKPTMHKGINEETGTECIIIFCTMQKSTIERKRLRDLGSKRTTLHFQKYFKQSPAQNRFTL